MPAVFPFASQPLVANLLAQKAERGTVSNLLLPILVFSIPVLAIVLLALSGRRLSGSCGGMNKDGSCNRCGRTAQDGPASDGNAPHGGRACS